VSPLLSRETGALPRYAAYIGPTKPISGGAPSFYSGQLLAHFLPTLLPLKLRRRAARVAQANLVAVEEAQAS
jgi:hypothetical protein